MFRQQFIGFCLKKVKVVFLLIAILFLITGCATTKENCEQVYKRTTFSFDQGTYPTDLDLFPEYHILPGDVLDVFYQIQRVLEKEYRITLYDTISVNFVDLPDLNVTQKVLPDGTIILPYIGPVKVVNKTPEEVHKEILKKYSGILRSPEFYVTVSDFEGRVDQLRKDLRTAPRGLSKLITVRPDGYATFPLVGEVLAAGKTVKQVNEILQRRYKKVLPGLKVDLFLHKSAGSVVYVLGEVKKPGAYEMKKPISLLEALALANGYTKDARLDSIIVCRRHERKLIARRVDITGLLKMKKGPLFFYLKPDDIVFVPKRKIASLSQFMQEIAGILLFKGFSIGWTGDTYNLK